MKNFTRIVFSAFLVLAQYTQFAQNGNPSPYCNGGYTTGNCNQGGPSNSPGNFINDFINTFVTSGGNDNINNSNSGCNNGPNNYNFYCNTFLSVNPGQFITCTLQSGITFAQGFAIWVDWNQDNVFQQPGEQVAATPGVPPAASTFTLGFTVPMGLPNGTYRLRVRCSYFTNGPNITPCGTFSFGETEDYNLIIGPATSNTGVITATVSSNAPLCAGQTLSLTAATNYTTPLTYTWTGPAAFTSTLQNPAIANAQASASGVYTAHITNGLCPVTKTVNVKVVPYPVYVPSPLFHAICQGGSFTASVSFATGQNPPTAYTYYWTSPTGGTGNTIWNPYSPSTLIQPLLLAPTVSVSTLVYSVTVSDTARFCPVTKTLTLTINNPFNPVLTPATHVCDNALPFSLIATPGGGTWTGTGAAAAAVSPGGVVTPTLAFTGKNPVTYSVTVNNCVVSKRDTFLISKFHSSALTSTLGLVCEYDAAHNLMNLVKDPSTGYWVWYDLTATPPTTVSGSSFSPANFPTSSNTFTYFTKSTFINITPTGPVTVTNNICPALTSMPVNLFNPPTPIINPIPRVCSNAPQATLTASPAGGVWSLNSGISAGGIQTPSLCSINNSSVTYAAGQGTCVASSTATLHVSQFNTAAITGTVPNLCVNNSPVNLTAIVQNTVNGNWSGVGVTGTTNVTGFKFDPANLPTNTYILTYTNASSPDPSLCQDTRTMAVSVLNPPSPAIAQIGPYCSTDGTLQLSVSPATGTWTSLSYVLPGGVFVPSLAIIGNNAVEYVIGTNTCNTKQVVNISVEAFVSAQITTPLADQCDNGSPVTLSPLTTNNLGTWAGPGVQGSNFNPAMSGAGQFVLSYNTASFPSGLCADQHTTAVRVFSLAPPTFVQLPVLCERATAIQLQVSPVGGLFSGGNTGAITPAGLFNPAVAIIGDNIVSYSISSGPCIAYAQTSITVEKFIPADLGTYPKSSYCINELPFNLNSLVKYPGGDWRGDNLTAGSPMFNPATAKPGKNLVTYYTQSATGLCPDTALVRIDIDEVPNISVLAEINQQCSPVSVALNVPTGVGTVEWNLGDGSASVEGYKIQHAYNTPGSYSVSVNYTLGACHISTTLHNPIKVSDSPTADFYFTKSEVSIAEPEVQAVNQSQVLGNNKYEWTVQGQSEPLRVISPMITFAQPGTYYVTLKATTAEGCSHEITRSIEVKNEFNAYIPNSFTPNMDGINDVFMPVFSPYGLDEKTYQMDIYDRWGHPLYHSRDITKGWDGTENNKGDEPMKSDSYLYIIHYKDLDGKNYERKGYLLLLPN